MILTPLKRVRSWLRFRRDLIKHQRQLADVTGLYDRLVADTEGEKRDALIAERSFEVGFAEDQLYYLMTRRLASEAAPLFVALPEISEDSDDWERSSTFGYWMLTRKGITSIEKAITEKKAARREAWQSWVTLLIGLVGALIGLVSVLPKPPTP